MSHDYLLVDVFTDRPLGGNALAVFPDGDRVPEVLRQPIAREMNLSETAFVTSVAGNRYGVRILTPTEELPFAGHPTLGTAWVIRHLGRAQGDEFLQVTAAGETRVRFQGDTVWLERGGSVEGALADRTVVARVLGLAEDDLGAEASSRAGRRVSLAPAFADAGVRQLMVPLRSREALSRIAPLAELGELAHGGVYAFVPLAGGRIEARFFAPGLGVGEDPATGSAAAALGLYLGAELGELAVEIAQGAHLGRPSRLLLRASPGRARVGGSVVLVGRGSLDV